MSNLVSNPVIFVAFFVLEKAITFKMLTSTTVASIRHWGRDSIVFINVLLGVEKDLHSFFLSGQM